jgi:hypothetical protein
MTGAGLAFATFSYYEGQAPEQHITAAEALVIAAKA